MDFWGECEQLRKAEVYIYDKTGISEFLWRKVVKIIWRFILRLISVNDLLEERLSFLFSKFSWLWLLTKTKVLQFLLQCFFRWGYGWRGSSISLGDFVWRGGRGFPQLFCMRRTCSNFVSWRFQGSSPIFGTWERWGFGSSTLSHGYSGKDAQLECCLWWKGFWNFWVCFCCFWSNCCSKFRIPQRSPYQCCCQRTV